MVGRDILRAVVVVAALASLLGFADPARAKLVKLEVTSKQDYGTFRRGTFVHWQGRALGELEPTEPIPDLDKATRNARGLVEYAAQVSLLMPADPMKGNGFLLVDIPNRGRPYAQAIYNSPRDEPFEAGTFEVGNGFLQDHGFSVAAVHWELGRGAELPSFTDAGGARMYVEGAGLAIVRDVADFLAHATADAGGTPNPLAGAVKWTLAAGKSQSGRYLKTFLFHGFNLAAGRRVFDGMHIFVSGAGMLPIMRSTAGPLSSTIGGPTFADPEFRGVHEDVLTIGQVIEHVRARGETPPRLMLINSTTDYLSRRASLARTGASGTEDQPIPDMVRIYDLAGASHVVLRKADCELPPERLDWSPISRVTLLHLLAWVVKGLVPPASRLMPLENAHGDPMVLRAPAHLPSAVIQVPQRDADGNAIGGVRLPDVAVPLGVHARQNPPLASICALAGGYVAFPRSTEAATGPARGLRPVLERYRERNVYVDRVRAAARQLSKEGLLLPDDAVIILHAAAENPLWQAEAP